MTARQSRTGRILRLFFVMQLLFAAVLLSSDLLRVVPELAFPSSAPALTQPLGPGDQTRRYAPRDITPRQALPGTRPVPLIQDQSNQLIFDIVRWKFEPTLIISGQIAPGDSDRFIEFLDRSGENPTLAFLDSPGGSVSDALIIGREIRDRGIATEMSGTDICLSACPYMLAGGTARRVEEGALVGVHQHYFGENTALPAFLAVEDIQRGQGEVMTYLSEMDVDPLLMQHALVTPPDEIYLLTAEELTTYNLITTAQ